MNKIYFIIYLLLFPIIIYAQTTTCQGVLDYEFYDLVPSGNTVDNIPKTGAKAIGEINNFNVGDLQNTIDPGDTDTYSIRYRGYINIATAGAYTFYTTSDDGSKLYIDDVERVNNDNNHGSRERASIEFNLSAGFHKIEVLFYENTGDNILQVRYKGPSIEKQLIPFPKLYSCIPNSPPKIKANGNLVHCIGGSTPIVESISIEDDQNQLEKVFIQISKNYDDGDLLTYTGGNANIESSWNTGEAKLTLTGPATLAEFEAAILAVEFSSTADLDDDVKNFSIVLSELNFLESSGHYYEYIPSEGITWTAAKAAAEDRNFYGVQGYLATITSADEATLLGEQSPGAGWIGASDAEVEGEWKWVTGPEAGQKFWQGTGGGTVVNGMYANWNTGEPNQSGNGNEDYAHVNAPGTGFDGSWNDLSNTGAASGAHQPKGYLVEYGGLNSGENFPDVSTVTKITPFVINEENQPEDQTIFVGDNASFSVTVKNVNTYQWQESKDGGATFSDITDATNYSGYTTASLEVLNPEIEKEGYVYRLVINNTESECEYVSEDAKLFVRVRTVLTNRNKTYRVDKN